MSIIYDALKKIEKSKIKEPSKNPTRNLKTYIIYASVVIFGFLIGNIAFSRLFGPQKTKQPLSIETVKQDEQKPLLSPQPPEPEKKTPKKEQSKESFVLNGIFFSEDQAYALINNQIVKAGDMIDEAKILSITSEEVELEADDSVFKLSTRIR